MSDIVERLREQRERAERTNGIVDAVVLTLPEVAMIEGEIERLRAHLLERENVIANLLRGQS